MRIKPTHKVFAFGAALGLGAIFLSEIGLLDLWLSFGSTSRSKVIVEPDPNLDA